MQAPGTVTVAGIGEEVTVVAIASTAVSPIANLNSLAAPRKNPATGSIEGDIEVRDIPGNNYYPCDDCEKLSIRQCIMNNFETLHDRLLEMFILFNALLYLFTLQ